MTILERLALPASQRAGGSALLDNEDLRPIPLARRTWSWFTFALFWPAAVSNVSNWLGGSSFLTTGITFWEGVGCSTAGYFLISIFMALNGRAGSKWHLSFPVAARSSFGVYGSFWCALNRAAMATVWNGVNSVSGGQCIYVMLHAIFPSIANLPNHMSANSALTTANMIGFFLFIFLTGLMLLLEIPKWNILIHLKLIIFTLSTIGMLVLVMTKAGGVGPIVHRAATVEGAEHSWLLVRFILVSAASCSTFASNASDWQRNATKPSDPILGQLLGFPLSNFIVQVLGMLCASASAGIYGDIIWNPVTLLDMILTDNYTSSIRAGAFFIAAGFTYSLLFSCVFENVLPFANDFASLAPKYVSLKRAFFVCLALTMIINPWYLLGSASIFITVLSSYQIFLFSIMSILMVDLMKIFLFSIMSILMVDYYLITKGFFHIDQLYTSSKEGIYYYTYGVNLRAIAAYLVGVAVNFAGFLTNFGIIKSVKLTHSYYFAIFTTTFAAGATYYILNLIWPQPNHQTGGWKEPKGVWEYEETAPLPHSESVEGSYDEDKDKETGLNVATRMVPEV